MKMNIRQLVGLLCLAALAVANHKATAQAPTIQSFSANGQLRASQLAPGTTATIEWAPEITGPWSDTWDSLTGVTVEADGTVDVRVPMFYRLRGVHANPDPARLVWISPGTFIMGSPVTEPGRDVAGADETQHEVTITHGFWMGKHEVTQAQYHEVMGNNPSCFRNGVFPLQSGGGINGSGGPVVDEHTHPVDSVSWQMAVQYCLALTERERAAGRLPDGYVYRPPTEAEWEYACRAGTTTAFHYGGELRSGMANFWGNQEYDGISEWVVNPDGIFLGRTSQVGSYEPNAWGLFDMHGNVLEWCHDWYALYPVEAQVDPTGPSTGSQKVFRSGCWWYRGRGCRSAFRGIELPSGGERLLFMGIRVVLARPVP